MPFTQSGTNAAANIGTYNDISGNQINNTFHGAVQDLLAKLEPVKNASFKSDRHSSCLKGTRVGLLEKLMEWAKNPHSQPIFWLSGIAGTGKSTISQTLCESLQNQNLLGASFFCSRESEDLRQVGKIVPTLAYFLAQHFKEYRNQIAATLEGDSTLASQGIKRQMETLLMDPLQKINSTKNNNWHFILVIDALDECEDRDATRNIISILRDMPAQFYSHIHIFVSSRPEYYIQHQFERTSNKDLFKLHDIDSEIIQKDIQLYLESTLHSVSKHNISCLAEQAGKLFIYAFTQVQYLKKAHGTVSLQSRLSELLENKVISESIDGLYNVILMESVKNMGIQEKEDAKYFVNIVVTLSDPLSQHALSELWKPCDGASFRSVLNIPESEEAPIHIFHASFPDYVLDQSRCHREFYCSPQIIHQKLALACVQYMNVHLKLNPCDMHTEDHVSSFSVGKISPALQYSCKHWIYHLTKCDNFRKEIQIELEKFVSEYFLFWMEDISILQSMDNAIPGLKSVISWLRKYDSEGSKFLQPFIYEGQRFLQLIAGLLKDYPLQLYYSGMAWLPKTSVLRKIRNLPQNVPRISQGLKCTWDMCEVTIRNADAIYSVAFSPDGKQVVSGSRDRRLCIWHVATGKQILEFDHYDSRSYPGIVQSVAYSPDGKQVVSGSMNNTVCIWHVATGKLTHILHGHFKSVKSVAFSPDGEQVLSGSLDGTVHIWHAATGKQIHKFYGDFSRVTSVAFSPDGKQVVSHQQNLGVDCSSRSSS